MGACAKFCGFVVVALAVLIGLAVSGTLSRMGAIKKLDEVMMNAGRFDLVGMTPSSYPDGKLPFTIKDIPSLQGKTALVTGANVGLGLETARQLAANGARVIIHCRSQSKCDKAKAEIDGSLPKGATPVETVTADLGNLAEVAEMAAATLELAPSLDIFVANAGIPSPTALTKTDDGIETTFAVNHMSHFLMFNKLRPALDKAAEKGVVRVVLVSSAASYNGNTEEDMFSSLEAINDPARYMFLQRYGLTKLHNVMFAREINERTGDNIIATSCHPGAVDTNIWEKNNAAIRQELPAWAADIVTSAVNSLRAQTMWSAEDGALTQLFLATKVDRADGGKYFHPVALAVPNPLADQASTRKALWDFSAELLQEKKLL